jgi:hypothetical protein
MEATPDEIRINVTGLQGNRTLLRAALGSGHRLLADDHPHNWTVEEVRGAVRELRQRRASKWSLASKCRRAAIELLEGLARCTRPDTKNPPPRNPPCPRPRPAG